MIRKHGGAELIYSTYVGRAEILATRQSLRSLSLTFHVYAYLSTSCFFFFFHLDPVTRVTALAEVSGMSGREDVDGAALKEDLKCDEHDMLEEDSDSVV